MNIPSSLPNPMTVISSSPLPSELTDHNSPDPMVIDQAQADPESTHQVSSDPLSVDQTDEGTIISLVTHEDNSRTFKIPLSKLKIIPGLYGQLNHGVNLKNKSIEVEYSPEIVNLLLLFCLKYNKEDLESLIDLEELFIDGTLSFDDLYAFYDLGNFYSSPLIIEWVHTLIQDDRFLDGIDHDFLKELWESVIKNGTEGLKENQIQDPYYQFVIQFLFGQRLYAAKYEDVEHLLELYVKNFGLDKLLVLFNQKNENGEFLFYLEAANLYPLIHYLLNPKEKREEEMAQRLEIAFALLNKFGNLLKNDSVLDSLPPLPAPPIPSQSQPRPIQLQSPPKFTPQQLNHLRDFAQLQLLQREGPSVIQQHPTLFQQNSPFQNLISQSPPMPALSPPVQQLEPRFIPSPSPFFESSCDFLPYFSSLCTILKNIDNAEDQGKLIEQFISQATLSGKNIRFSAHIPDGYFINSASLVVDGLLFIYFKHCLLKEQPTAILEFLKIAVGTLLKLENSSKSDCDNIIRAVNDTALTLLLNNPSIQHHLRVLEILVNFKQHLLDKDFKAKVDLLFAGFSELPISEVSEEEIETVHRMLLHLAEKYPNDRIHFLSAVANHYGKCDLHSKDILIKEIKEKYFDLQKSFIIRKICFQIRKREKDEINKNSEINLDEITKNKMGRILELLKIKERGKAKIKCNDLIRNDKLLLEFILEAILEDENLGYKHAFNFAKVLDGADKLAALKQVFYFLIKQEKFKEFFNLFDQFGKKQEDQLLCTFIDAASSIVILNLKKKETSEALGIFKKYILKYLKKGTISESISEVLLEFIKTQEKAAIEQVSRLTTLRKRSHQSQLLHLIIAAKMLLTDWKGVDQLMETIGSGGMSAVLPLIESTLLLKQTDMLIPEILSELKKYAVSSVENCMILSQYIIPETGSNVEFYKLMADFCISTEDLVTLEEIFKIPNLNYYLVESYINNDLLLLKNKISRREGRGIDDQSIAYYFKIWTDNQLCDLGRKLGHAGDRDLFSAIFEKFPKKGSRYSLIGGYLEALSSKSLPDCLMAISQLPCEYHEAFWASRNLNGIICQDKETMSRCKLLRCEENIKRAKFSPKKASKNPSKSTKGKEKIGAASKSRKRKNTADVKEKQPAKRQLVKKEKEKEKNPENTEK